MTARIDPAILDAIDAALMERAGSRRKGDEIIFSCTDATAHANGDRKPSAGWNRKKLQYNCFGCGAGGGALDLAERLAIELPKRNRAQPARQKLRKVRYPARRADGGPLKAEHVRLERVVDGKKEDMWWERDGRKGLNGLRVEELALYRVEDLNELPDGAIVVLCEGEKAADALVARGIVAVGTVTGASTIPCDDALTALTRFNVILWPDADADE